MLIASFRKTEKKIKKQPKNYLLKNRRKKKLQILQKKIRIKKEKKEGTKN
jgi:hypothetical protein